MRYPFIVTLAFLIAGCAAGDAAPPPSSAAVARAPDGAFVVSWTAAGPVDVWVAASPGGDDRRLISDNDADGTTSMPAQATRPYFLLTLDGETKETWVAERVLPLEGGRNFRDLGGYPTTDGRVVRWGALYRSGVMHELTDADYRYLDGLGIKTVCDFRSTVERADEPTRWRAAAVDYRFRDYDDASSSVLRTALTAPDLSGPKVAATMAGLYEGMLDRFSGHYADMFDQLVAGKAPLAFNCSAGKDRTGIAAALVLTALGVPREVILADYAMSEQVVNYEAAYSGPDAPAADGPYAFLAKLPAEVRAPLLRSDPAYLEAAFARMEREHGSVEGFLAARLDVSAADVEKLRDLYLVPAK